MAHEVFEVGSPPHMRGKVKRQQATAPPGQDHPRICGEKNSTIHSYLNSTGSPPRMRGKVLLLLCPRPFVRITPAYARKRQGASHGFWQAQDYPRICGEKISLLRMACSPMGSPPHMRGKDTFKMSLPISAGITPAYAGKRVRRRSKSRSSRDHPRICGEKAKYWMQGREPEGSPPHMRGKAFCP